MPSHSEISIVCNKYFQILVSIGSLYRMVALARTMTATKILNGGSIWAGAQHFLQECMCTPGRLGSDCTTVQSDQSGQPGIRSFFSRIANTLIRFRGCTGWSKSSLSAHAVLVGNACSVSFRENLLWNLFSSDRGYGGCLPRLNQGSQKSKVHLSWILLPCCSVIW